MCHEICPPAAFTNFTDLFFGKSQIMSSSALEAQNNFSSAFLLIFFLYLESQKIKKIVSKVFFQLSEIVFQFCC
jgi:hypothetical protein